MNHEDEAEYWRAEAVEGAEDDELWARRRGLFDGACFFQNQAKRIASGCLTRGDFLGHASDWRQRLQLSGATHARVFSSDRISSLLEA